jgi:DNA-binding NarL/FixJ family response regulator
VRVTVLIADDASLIRSNLKKLIERSRGDISFKESANTADTIRMLGDGGIDVLILDLEFPDGSGFDVLQQIGKEHSGDGAGRENGRPFVIVLTNHAREQLRNKSLRMGADHFFDKSNEYERAVDVIKRL